MDLLEAFGNTTELLDDKKIAKNQRIRNSFPIEA